MSIMASLSSVNTSMTMVLKIPKPAAGMRSENGLEDLQNFTKAIKVGKYKMFRQTISLLCFEIFMSYLLYFLKHSKFYFDIFIKELLVLVTKYTKPSRQYKQLEIIQISMKQCLYCDICDSRSYLSCGLLYL